MKIYHSLNVETTIQPNGSNLVLILRGCKREIVETANGLYNLKATGGEPEFTKLESNGRTEKMFDYALSLGYTGEQAFQILNDAGDLEIATLWSTPEDMYSFFVNRHEVKFGQKGIKSKHAALYAKTQMEQLLQERETFIKFTNKNKFFEPSPDEVFGMGHANAEKPDNDMKDEILAHALQDNSGAKKEINLVEAAI